MNDLLRVTVIDVGWGDSLLLEARDDQGEWRYALVDCNDTSTLRSSYIFLRRFFERARPGLQLPADEPVFDWVLLTHAHADHGQGLKSVLREFGTVNFWHSKTNSTSLFFTDLLRYARRSSQVEHYQAIDETKILPAFGLVSLKVLWPPYDQISSNENNNSVVLLLEVGSVAFLLTGDAEADVWDGGLASRIPANTRFFKVPHHGSEDATFTRLGSTPWLDQLAPDTVLAISSHVRPFPFPHDTVVNHLETNSWAHYRTDRHFHATIATDGTAVTVQYSHI